MKHGKCRVTGAILLVLALALLTVSVLSLLAPKDGTPLSAAYAQARSESAARDRVNAALSSASEALTRADKRVAAALSESNACLAAAHAAEEKQASASYDAKTDVGALGNAIARAQAAGADMTEVLDSFAPVANAELVDQLETAKTTVKRGETAVEDAEKALNNLLTAAKALGLTMETPDLPELQTIVVPKLGSLTGTARLITRGENYLSRSQTAEANIQALAPVGEAILSAVETAASQYHLPVKSSVILFTAARGADLATAAGILLVVALLLTFLPARLKRWWQISLFRKGFLFVSCVALLACALHYADGETWALMRQGVSDTLYMTIPSTFFAYVLGLPLGILLVITSPNHIRPNPTFNSVLGTIINFLRSIPFLILLVLLFDVTRFVMGTAIGTRAVIFPLFVSAFPFVARVVEGSINEVDRGVIEAAESMGSTLWQIIRKVLIPEALPSLVNGAALCMTTILAYTTMAGSAGGDGLGKIAITYGLNYRNYDVMYISSLLLVVLVQIIQIAGTILTRGLDHRRK